MRRAIISLILLAPLAGCGITAGDKVTGGGAQRAFPATGFDRVRLAGADDIAIATGPAFAVTADGDSATLDRIEVAVTDGELRVGRENSRSGWLSWMSDGGRAKVHVTLPVLRGVTVAGAGSADVTEAKAPVFVGAVEGAGNLDVRGIDVGTAAFRLSGAGNIALAGRAGDVTMDVSGAGNLSAATLAARDLDISLSGVGSVDARASGRAQIRVGGVGSVAVKGTDDCRITKSGVGNVTCGR